MTATRVAEVWKTCPACGDRMGVETSTGKGIVHVAWCDRSGCDWHTSQRETSDAAETELDAHRDDNHSFDDGVAEEPRRAKGEQYLKCVKCEKEEAMTAVPVTEVEKACPACGDRMGVETSTGEGIVHVAWCDRAGCDWKSGQMETSADAETELDTHRDDNHTFDDGMAEEPRRESARAKGQQYLKCVGCDGEEEMPVAAIMRAQGVTPLFTDEELAQSARTE